ncbi:MAG: response regulator [Bryobacterales bacterium]|nr:response regulator [Bryobacterales bacterium]
MAGEVTSEVSSQSTQGSHRPVRVLVVDDDPDVRLVLCRMLESGGYETAEARHGREALEAALEYPFDVLITDLIMPEQEGIETIQQFHQIYPHMKIIAISGAYGSDYLRIAKHLGAHEVMQKPLRLEVVLNTVSRLMRGG